jgi:hypothetical protein
MSAAAAHRGLCDANACARTDTNQSEPLPPLVFKKPRRKSSEVVRAHGCVLCEKRYGTRAALSLHFKLKHELPLRTLTFSSFFFFFFSGASVSFYVFPVFGATAAARGALCDACACVTPRAARSSPIAAAAAAVGKSGIFRA